MRYIVCEDSGSGFYFWSLIKEYVLELDYEMVTLDMMNEILPESRRSSTIGVGIIARYLSAIAAQNKEDTYIICVDNATDNEEIGNDIAKIYQIAAQNGNMYVFDYICFEQLILAAGKYENFIPGISENDMYKVVKQHYMEHGLQDNIAFKRMLRKEGIRQGTTEKLFSVLMMNVIVQSEKNIGKRKYLRMRHHYICKSSWSVCWKIDCTEQCPNDRCWEATGSNAIMCKDCEKDFKEYSNSCKMMNKDDVRKFAEETVCDRKLPEKYMERVRLLFDIPEVRKIDTYG
ncbi:MAG: hypothetical protein J6A77_05105 [Lachnospiraceae bacterium]|nr:hypothetical protein [Lachnospiraceae bacterium]